MSNSSVSPGFQFDSNLDGYTDSDLIIYVDGSIGDNTNSGRDPLFPMATIQAALARVPKKIKHGVKIKVAAGNYAGAVVSGFSVLPADDLVNQVSYLHIEGTYANATPASTGLSSGSLSSYSAQSGSTFAIATDSLNNMTVNEYAGKYLLITGGTGATGTVARPAMHLIISNTATAFTILTNGGTVPAAASTYQVISMGTAINACSVLAANSLSPANALAVASATGICFANNEGNGFAVSQLAFTLATATITSGIGMQEHRLRAFMCQFNGAAGTVNSIKANNVNVPVGGLELLCCDFRHNSGVGVPVSFTSSGGQNSMPGPSVNSCAFTGGTGHIALSAAAYLLVSSCYFTGATNNSLSLTGVSAGQLLNSRWLSNGRGIAAVEAPSAGMPATSMGINNCDFTSNTTVGMYLSGTGANFQLGTVTGTLNGQGIRIERGSKMIVGSGTTLTGTTEVLFEGVGTTLAAMRALTPKAWPAVASPYGTTYFE